MVEKVLMPQLGASMETGTILQWFKQEGDTVNVGEPLFEVMTDKTNIEIEAEHSGTIIKIKHKVDEEVPVHQVIAYIGEAGEQVTENKCALDFSRENGFIKEKKPSESSHVTVGIEWINKPRRTPAARKLAEINQVDLDNIKGSGPKGRIHLKDVERYLAEIPAPIKATPLAKKVALEKDISLNEVKGTGVQGKIVRNDIIEKTQSNLVPLQKDGEKVQKLKGMRKVIAQRMVQSAFTAPHATLTNEVDMTNVIELRKQLLPVIQEQIEERISYTEIIMKAVSNTLIKHPIINAAFQNDTIIYHNHVNLGLAVAVPNGLIVPVIENVDKLGFAALTKECKKISKVAREGKLKPNQLKGSTFTLSNLGMFDVDSMTPIINQPELAILATGKIKEKPVVVKGSIEVRSMMTMNLSIDHRIIDGAPAAAFLTDLKKILENPTLLLV